MMCCVADPLSMVLLLVGLCSFDVWATWNIKAELLKAAQLNISMACCGIKHCFRMVFSQMFCQNKTTFCKVTYLYLYTIIDSYPQKADNLEKSTAFYCPLTGMWGNTFKYGRRNMPKCHDKKWKQMYFDFGDVTIWSGKRRQIPSQTLGGANARS